MEYLLRGKGWRGSLRSRKRRARKVASTEGSWGTKGSEHRRNVGAQSVESTEGMLGHKR